MLFLNPSAATLGRFLVGIVFLAASIGKWLDREGFAKAVTSYQVLPQSLARPVAIVIPWIETALGLLLITNRFTLIAAALSCGLLTIFTVAQLVVFARRQKVDCHCFSILDQEEVGLHTILRNAMLIAIVFEVLVFNWRHAAPETWSPQASGSQFADPAFTPAEYVLLFLTALGIVEMYLLAHQARKMLT